MIWLSKKKVSIILHSDSDEVSSSRGSAPALLQACHVTCHVSNVATQSRPKRVRMDDGTTPTGELAWYGLGWDLALPLVGGLPLPIHARISFINGHSGLVLTASHEANNIWLAQPCDDLCTTGSKLVQHLIYFTYACHCQRQCSQCAATATGPLQRAGTGRSAS